MKVIRRVVLPLPGLCLTMPAGSRWEGPGFAGIPAWIWSAGDSPHPWTMSPTPNLANLAAPPNPAHLGAHPGPQVSGDWPGVMLKGTAC